MTDRLDSAYLKSAIIGGMIIFSGIGFLIASMEYNNLVLKIIGVITLGSIFLWLCLIPKYVTNYVSQKESTK